MKERSDNVLLRKFNLPTKFLYILGSKEKSPSRLESLRLRGRGVGSLLNSICPLSNNNSLGSLVSDNVIPFLKCETYMPRN